jgi:hypothetical protein
MSNDSRPLKLISEIIAPEKTKIIIEENEETGAKSTFITGPFIVAEERNKNGRVYSRNSIEREVNSFINNKISKNRAGGELNHPDTPIVDLERISHYITELRQDDNVWYGKAKLSSAPKGLVAQALVNDGYQLGVSTRGLGQVAEDGEVSEDYRLITVDLVSDPSAPGAFMEAINENRQYIISENGAIMEVPLNNLKRAVEVLPVKQSIRDTVVAEAISNFIKEIDKNS